MNFTFLKKRSSFTVIELLLVAAIFGVVILVGASSLLNMNRAHRRLVLQDYVLIETRHLMQRIAREIYQNTVDYEEYHSRIIESLGGVDLASNAADYGQNYGGYALKFYNKGVRPDLTDDEVGCVCSNDPLPETDPNYPKYGCPVNDVLEGGVVKECIIYRPSVDVNTGQNPYSALDETEQKFANAMCDHSNDTTPTACPLQQTINELYLIDATGKQKTMLVREQLNTLGEKALAMIRLNGFDTDDDGDMETWKCDDAFSCVDDPGAGATQDRPDPKDRPISTLSVHEYNFVPITPLNINVLGFDVMIMPQEDPHKAFAENDSTVQIQPRMTVILTVQPSEEAKRIFKAEGFAPMTLQATFSSQILTEVESFAE